MYTKVGGIDFPTDWCKGQTLEGLQKQFNGQVADKFIKELHVKLNPKQKQPKKKTKVETKVTPKIEFND